MYTSISFLVMHIGCGVRAADLPTGSQIVGGQRSTKKWPWMLSVTFVYLIFDFNVCLRKNSLSEENYPKS